MRTRIWLKVLSATAFAIGIGATMQCLAAEDPTEDAAKLYDLVFDAPKTIAAGASGAVTVTITPKDGAEVHKEAPVKLTLKAPEALSLSKVKAGRDDLKLEGPVASFAVPFEARSKGPTTIDAKLSFFICTDQVCARQVRDAKLMVAVE